MPPLWLEMLLPWVRIGYKIAGLEKVVDLTYQYGGKQGSDRLPYARVIEEFTDAHQGGGWFRDEAGQAFRSSLSARVARSVTARIVTACRCRNVPSRSGVPSGRVGSGNSGASARRSPVGSRRFRVDPSCGSSRSSGSLPTPRTTSRSAPTSMPSSLRAAWCTTVWVSTTRTATPRSTTRWCGWRRTSRSTRRSSTGTATSARPDDGPAAARYTEARMSREAMLLVGELGEDTVDFEPNYDGSLTQPTVLPAAFPNLLVNGASGHRGRHGHQHDPAQPRRGGRGRPLADQPPGRHAGQAHGVRPRPRPAHRRAAARPGRGAPGVRDRARRGAHARPGGDRPAGGQPRPAGHHRRPSCRTASAPRRSSRPSPTR